MIHQKQLGNIEYFNFLGNMLTSDTKSTREIKSSIAMEKVVLNNTTVSTGKLYLNLREDSVKILKSGAGEGWRISVRRTV
jgi:hypothetical protein